MSPYELIGQKINFSWPPSVESGVDGICSGAKQVREGLLVSAGDEVRNRSRLPHFNKIVIVLYFVTSWFLIQEERGNLKMSVCTVGDGTIGGLF